MWKEVVKDEIWSHDHFIDESLVTDLIEKMEQSQFSEFQPKDSIRNSFRASGSQPTIYSYKMHLYPSREDHSLVDQIFSKLDLILKPMLGIECPRVDLNALQFFSKSFNSHSFYELHTEPSKKFGPYAFILFLSDETECPLVFPSESEVKKLCESNYNLDKIWKETKELLLSYDEYPRCLSNQTFYPKRNSCLLFKMGSAHYVEKPSNEKSNFFRPTLTGWPFASDEFIQQLDTNCKISSYFG